MLKKNFSELILVVPVYRGGIIFLEALKSAERSGIVFDKVIVSFNEVGDVDFETFRKACESHVLKGTYTVLRTRCELDAHHHGRFIIDRIKESATSYTLILFLAHDDRFVSQPETAAILEFYSSLNSHSVYFPSYSCCKVEDVSKITEVIEHEEVITSEEFFWRTQKMNVPTSMSGMIVPLNAWDEAVKVLMKSGSGARFEHLLAISQAVKTVYFHKCIRTLILSRPDSDAAYLTLLQHRRASLYYVYTFARNGRVKGYISGVAFAWEFLKKLAAVIIAYLGLGFSGLRLRR
jgi:hypothetical protein